MRSKGTPENYSNRHELNISIVCECGEVSLIGVNAWYGDHLTDQFRLICKDCKKTARVIE